MKCFFVLVVFIATLSLSTANAEDWIKYQEISDIYFRVNNVAYRKRSDSVPQLQCISGCSSSAEVDGVHCTRRILNYQELNAFGDERRWKCSAQQYGDYAYDITYADVQCEGYEYDGDSRVRTGSCCLRYKIDHSKDRDSTDFDGAIAVFVVFFLIFVIIASFGYDSHYHQPYGYYGHNYPHSDFGAPYAYAYSLYGH